MSKLCGGRCDPEALAPHMKQRTIHESRQPSHVYYKKDTRTGVAKPPQMPWTKKADKYSYTKQSTFFGGDFDDSVTQKDYADPSDYTGTQAAKPVTRYLKGGSIGRKKTQKLGYTSQVANVVFNQGSKRAIHLGTDKGFPKHTESSSNYRGGRLNKRQPWQWSRNTADGFKNFSTKPPHEVSRTGMTHPRANTKIKPNEKTHYTAVQGSGMGAERPLSLLRNGAGARLGNPNTATGQHGLGYAYEL